MVCAFSICPKRDMCGLSGLKRWSFGLKSANLSIIPTIDGRFLIGRYNYFSSSLRICHRLFGMLEENH